MANLLQRLKTWLSGGEPATPVSMEELRASFRARYHAFKLLLAANNNALELMTDMEAALRGSVSFGMTFIRSHATAVCVNVFSIIKYLNELSGNRYQALEGVFAGLEKKVHEALKTRQVPVIRELVLPLNRVHREMADGVGSKMANLGEISSRLPEITVPDGFAVTAAAYRYFIKANQLDKKIERSQPSHNHSVQR